MISTERSRRVAYTRALCFSSLFALSGCATFLDVHGAEAGDRSPGGIAVNQRAVYGVSVTRGQGASRIDLKHASELVAIDPERVTAVNWHRMIFSSGELSLKLTGEQVLKEVSLTGKTGSARAAEAASSVVSGATEIQKINSGE